MRTLIIRKGAPETPEPHSVSLRRLREDTCISPTGFWNLSNKKGGKYRCGNRGTIKTNKGMLCASHARVYARRGWINSEHLRIILAERAQEAARRAAKRASCLRAGKCL